MKDFGLNSDSGLVRMEKALDFLARRQEMLAANVANLSTPGYKSVDVRFESVLDDELSNLRLIRTSPRHFEVVVPDPELKAFEVEGLPAGADGNNVELDRELLQMALNRVRFQMSAQAATSRIQTLKTAILEGRS